MILACGAVHTHLVRQSLRSYASINVQTGECLDTHYFAVLIGVGATTVNAYLAQEAIAERHRRVCSRVSTMPNVCPLQKGDWRRIVENHVQDGDLGYCVLSGRL